MTDTPDKLVADLRSESIAASAAAWGRPDGGQDYCIAAQLADAAADRIELLVARVAELEAQLASGSFYQEKDIDAMQGRIAFLEARIQVEHGEKVALAADLLAEKIARNAAEARLAPIAALAGELAPLHEAATKGPWHEGPSSDNNGHDPVETAILAEDGSCPLVAIMLPPSEMAGNVALTIALRNGAAAIIAAGKGESHD
jgi:hypothetical protein